MISSEARDDLDRIGRRDSENDTSAVHATLEPAMASPVVQAILQQLDQASAGLRAVDATEVRASVTRDLEEIAHRGPWLALPECVELAERYGAWVGIDVLRHVGRRTLQFERRAGLLAPILRSWIRAFQVRPELLLRVGPHLWRAAVRNGGRVELQEQGRTSLVFRVHDTPAALRNSLALRAIVEGIGEGLFDVAEVEGRCITSCPPDVNDALDLAATWSPTEAT